MVALQVKIDFADILQALTTIDLPYGRGNILRGINDSYIIDGTYNGGFEPILSGVRLADRLAQSEGKGLIAILGDMRELGAEETARHQELWGELQKLNSVQYIFVGKVCETIILPMLSSEDIKRVSFYRDARKAGEYTRDCILKSDKKILVFAKGSQNTIYLEEALKAIILPEETMKIVRQDALYMEKKQAFWKTLAQ